MAGRTDRAIIADTLTMAGVAEPARHVEDFMAELSRRAPDLRARFAAHGHALPGAAAALAAVAAMGPDAVQSVLTGNLPAIAEAKLAALGLAIHLDLEIGAYGDHHEVRAELVHLARQRAAAAYGRDFSGAATVLVGDTPLDVEAALATGARSVAVATGGSSAADLAAAGAARDPPRPGQHLRRPRRPRNAPIAGPADIRHCAVPSRALPHRLSTGWRAGFRQQPPAVSVNW